MDTRDWKIVVELHRTGNITRAANEIGMTQPALSKRLQLIELEMGTRLVVRTPRGVAFTPEGEYLAEEASKLLHHIGKIRARLRSFEGRRGGRIELGMTNSFVRYTIPSVLKAYSADHSDVEFGITTAISSEIVDKLAKGDIDVGFVCGDLKGDYSRYLLGTDHACLVNSEELRLEDLPDRPQIAYLSDPYAKRMVEDWWGSHFQKPPQIGMRANHGDTCLELVANGHGYGIILSPKFLSPSRPLFRMPLYYPDQTPLARNLWMIWRAGAYDVRHIRDFLTSMEERLAFIRDDAAYRS